MVWSLVNPFYWFPYTVAKVWDGEAVVTTEVFVSFVSYLIDGPVSTAVFVSFVSYLIDGPLNLEISIDFFESPSGLASFESLGVFLAVNEVSVVVVTFGIVH